MTDEEFVTELARRLNTFLEQNPDRANLALSTPLSHAGYAGVAHFLGELAMPSGIANAQNMGELKDAMFLYPTIENDRLVRFEVMRGDELAKKAEEADKAPVH